MIVKIGTATFGVLILKSTMQVYVDAVKAMGHGSSGEVSAVILCCLVGLLIIYNNIPDRPFLSY